MKHIVGFSGGADSQATALWVRQRFPAEDIILLNTQAGRNECPVTIEFVKWYSENVFPVTEVVPLIKDLQGVGSKGGASKQIRDQFSPDDELTFDRLACIKGRFPSRKAQFCTEFLKLRPQKRWMGENLPDGDYECYSGVRANESQARKHRQAREFDEYFDCYLNHPIVDWTKEQVFAFLRENGEKWNPLYELGFSRVGCAPCINSGKEDIRNWADRFPEMIDKIREWEASVGRTFFAPMVPGKAINWVDEVVTWSRTSRGGRQLFIVYEPPAACSSKYGLCE